jgi:methanogenic corrinoid protein MtbC1
MEIVSLCSGRDAGALRSDEDWHAPDARKAHPVPGLRDARGALSRVIEAEIIPRLALAHQLPPQGQDPGQAPGQGALPDIESAAAALDLTQAVPAASDVSAFVAMLRTASYPAVLGHVQGLRADGVSAESILLDLFAPAARHLGELWKADLCDFVEVTMALSVLQQLVREHSAGVGMEGFNWTDHRRLLLAPAPGDQHTFGVAIVEKFFRSAGWDVWGGAAGLAFDLPALVRREWFGVVGFSLGCEKNLDALVQLIRQVRRASRNARLGVIVGGPAFLERPDLAVLIGADATAVDANSAVPVAQGLLEIGAAAF